MSHFPGVEKLVHDGHSYYIDPTFTFVGGHMPNVGRQMRAFQKQDPLTHADKEELRGDDMPGKVDEGLWSKAKAQAKKQYPDFSEDSPRFWKVVSSIYKKMGGKFTSKMEKALEFCEAVERVTPSFIKDERIWLRALQKSGATLENPAPALENLGLTVRTYAELGGHLQKSSMLDDSLDAVRGRNISDNIEMEKAEAGGVKPHKYVERIAGPGGKWKYKYGGQAGSQEAHPGSQKPQTGAPAKPQAAPQAPSKKPAEGIARAIEKLSRKTSREQKAALQNVSDSGLAAIGQHAPEKSPLRAMARQEAERRKSESVRKQAAGKEKPPMEKSQSQDLEFNSFCNTYSEDVKKSLAAEHADWDSKTLDENTRATLQQLYRRA